MQIRADEILCPFFNVSMTTKILKKKKQFQKQNASEGHLKDSRMITKIVYTNDEFLKDCRMRTRTACKKKTSSKRH